MSRLEQNVISLKILDRTGAAIVVDVQRSSPVFSELIYNPQCFLIYEDPLAQPAHWEDVRSQEIFQLHNNDIIIIIVRRVSCPLKNVWEKLLFN